LNPSVIMSVKAFTKNYTSSYFFYFFKFFLFRRGFTDGFDDEINSVDKYHSKILIYFFRE
jgi:hypothetical protein